MPNSTQPTETEPTESPKTLSVRPSTTLAVTVLDSLLALVYPPRCILCGVHAAANICEPCLATLLTPLPEPICEVCGHARRGSPCLSCRNDPPDFDAVRSAGMYTGDLQSLIHSLKYHDRPRLANSLGLLLARTAYDFQHSLGELEYDFIAPVPMHQSRQRRRGYNQADRLARIVAAELHLPYAPDLLVRTRASRPQVGLKHDARLRNVESAFRIGPHDVAGLRILIIDDVSTTGATFRNCAAPLKAAGAKVVYGLALAAG